MLTTLNAPSGRRVSVLLDENDAPGVVSLPGGRGTVRIARVLDRWQEGEPSGNGGEPPLENWLVTTDGPAAETAAAEAGICLLQHFGRAEWRLYGWPEQAASPPFR